MSELKRVHRAHWPMLPLEQAVQTQDISPLAFRLAFPDRPSTLVDLTEAKCPQLARELAAVLRALSGVGRRIASPGTAQSYTQAVRKLDAFCSQRGPWLGEWTLARLGPADVDAFELWLYEVMPTRRTAYALLTMVMALLREARDELPEAVDARLHDRLMFTGRQERPSSVRPVDAYPPAVAEALRAACRGHIAASVRRLTVEADALVAAGEDPLVGGWGRRENVLWRLDRDGPMSRAAMQEFRTRRSGFGTEPWDGKLTELHRALFPTDQDLVAALMLLMLSTGLEPESALELRADCLKNPTRGFVEIDYLKRRRHGEENCRMRVRDGGASTPGGLIRLVLRLTRRARAHAQAETATALWLYWQSANHSRIAGGRRSFRPRFAAERFCARYGVTDTDGKPLMVQLRRLRKTYKAEFYRLTKGQLPLLAQGHSAEVAVAHYADIPALRPVHEAAVADALTQALDEAVQLRVITPGREEELRQDPQAAARELDIPEEAAGQLLAGGMDLWLSSCRDFFNSPFGTAGQACPVPFWSCLDCSNAVVTSRKLPAVLAYLDHLEAQRQSMPEQAFAAAHGRTRQRILTQVLPKFPQAVIDQARAIAESTHPLENLPPVLGGIGSRQ